MKYYLDIRWIDRREDFNALSKARKDVISTLEQQGFKCLPISIKQREIKSEKTLRQLKVILLFRLLLLSIGRRFSSKDEILIQYPCLNKTDLIVSNFFIKKKCKLIFLIHDLEFLRYHNSPIDLEYEVKSLKRADVILSHNEAMTRVLVHNCIAREKIKEIYLFDYYSFSSIIPPEIIREKKFEVAFAGNLQKSRFLKEIESANLGVLFKLYGVDNGYWANKKMDTIEYVGCFNPDDPSMLSAGWGLVWDGDKLDTCSGVMGNYLRYNTSHKLSLYLSSGMPVIVWRQSAIAPFIENERLGLVVDSLEDVKEAILMISDKEYGKMLENVRKIGERLRNGFFLKKVIIWN